MHHKHKRRWPLGLVGVLIAAALLAGKLLFGGLPVPARDALSPVRPSTLILDRNGSLLYEAMAGDGKQTPLAFEQIPAACWEATVAVEDSRFYNHPGVDPLAIGRAAWQNWQGGAVVSGASTITQQLARNTLMAPEERYEQTLRRKLREAWLAVQIELRFTKNEILALYLNQVYYGNFAYGLEAAAEAYFGKSARELDLAECSLLAGLLQNPGVYNPLQDLEAARWRQAAVLSAMVGNGYIERTDAAMAHAETLRFAATPFPIEAPHFVSYAESQLERLLGADRVSQGGLRVTTTLDLAWSRRAEAITRRRLEQVQNDPNAPRDRRVENAAVIALDPQSGAIRIMVGSPDYFDASIDGAMNAAVALRQPGSAIKPLTYAAAMDPEQAATAGRAPLTAATVIADVRTAFLTSENEPYVPQNYDLTWHGPVSARTALASSYNLPAVKVLDSIGIDTLIDQAQKQGITTFRPGERYGLALTLGGGEVTLVELTAAYAAFASGGARVQPYAIDRVEDASGAVLFQAPASQSRNPAIPQPHAVDPRVAYLITNILSDDMARAPSFGLSSVLTLTRPAAVKTGTTTDWRDNWTVGYTPDLVTGVWVGNADNTPMLGVSGVTGAGPIWHDVMEMAHKNLPVRPFQQPPGLVRAEVCVDSGLLPTQWCSRRTSELFIAGTEPTAFDTVYRPIVVDTCRGGLAGPTTTDGCRAEQVQRVYPHELQEWARANGISPVNDSGEAQSAAGLTAQASTNALAANSPALVLTSPDPNGVYQLAEGLPQEQQRLRLAARSGGEAIDRVTFWVNNQQVGYADHPPFELWWQLQRGTFMIQAVTQDSSGRPIETDPIWIEVN
jgi:1A family penicillin-binding protein